MKNLKSFLTNNKKTSIIIVISIILVILILTFLLPKPIEKIALKAVQDHVGSEIEVISMWKNDKIDQVYMAFETWFQYPDEVVVIIENGKVVDMQYEHDYDENDNASILSHSDLTFAQFHIAMEGDSGSWKRIK